MWACNVLFAMKFHLRQNRKTKNSRLNDQVAAKDLKPHTIQHCTLNPTLLNSTATISLLRTTEYPATASKSLPQFSSQKEKKHRVSDRSLAKLDAAGQAATGADPQAPTNAELKSLDP
ncbi:hypothetical protein M758_1G016100 [Ceratodon purpureus]|uniref:Uncharacterized protein n=1 Tax=Ceratodon purpureus TaxID=3225 RepID=A0A8T0J2B8_CERPU|nr:hypothetical protein KC19_1G016800 [Ceratodon purpureus]KAG0628297.1 hypothetical protein M758_1G016100 [Ceratodon purpureus]